MPGETEAIETTCAHVRLRDRSIVRALLAVACAAGLLGCANEKSWNGELPAVDMPAFETDVYPVLMRDCSFNDCHAGTHRFFRVVGPGRVRLDPKTMLEDPVTPQEIQFTYDHARAMLITEGPVTKSPLLTKPLAIKAGGSGHFGVDSFGRNVYQSKDDPSYQVLLHWAQTATAAPPTGTGGHGMTGSGGSGMTSGTGGRGMPGQRMP